MSLTLPKGYYWSPILKTPNKLLLTSVSGFYSFMPGLYDLVCIPVGDNWSIADPSLCKFTTVELKEKGSFSWMPVFPKDEPSCGSLLCVRGPYSSGGTPPSWQINSTPSGMAFRRLSMPVYSHAGARHGRYFVNGYAWAGTGGYPSLNSGYWGNSPVGAKLLWKNERAKVKPSENGPDVTIISNLKAGKIYVSITKVDMFGRETSPSEPLEINIDNDASFATVRRDSDTEVGTTGFYVYAGYSPTDMHRQPILADTSRQAKYLWPVTMQFHIHKIVETGIRAVPPSSTVGLPSSIIPKPLKQVVDGEIYIDFDQDYDLYCPFILPWVPAKFGRKLGTNGKRCVFTHRNMYGNAKLVNDSQLLIMQNQADEISNATFKSGTASAGVTFSDWSGGQSFSDAITNCRFILDSEDSTGFLVEDVNSSWNGNHTASEIRVKNTLFSATIPVKIEGNQSAKIRFNDMCSFNSNGNTKYKSDTTGIIYSCCPNQISVNNCEGVNGAFRTLFCLASYSGPGIVTIHDLFCDAGCYVYAVYAAFSGGRVSITGGERINAYNQEWVRLAEAPSSLKSTLRIRDTKIVDNTSSISLQLNQLALDLDFNVGEVVCPTEEFWLSKGLYLEYPAAGAVTSTAYYDFTQKPIKDYSFNFRGLPDSLPQKNPGSISTLVLVGQSKERLSSHWAGTF